MSTMTNLFETLNQERTILLDAITPLPEAFLDEKGIVGEWSIKNVLAHLTGWERTVTDFLPDRLATGSRPAIFAILSADEDAWNAQEVASREHLTPKEQLDEFERARQGLLQMLHDTGEEALNRQNPWPEWQGTLATYILEQVGGHESEHREATLAAVERLRERLSTQEK
jgi:DinB superfamily